MKHIFVYGSLRKGEGAHKMLSDCEFVEEVRLPGYDLYALTWFPGIVKNPDNAEGVVGELYELPDKAPVALLQTIDYYEGYFPNDLDRSLFKREVVEVKGHPTFIYTLNKDPFETFGTSARVIRHGDWKHYGGDLNYVA